MEFVPVKITGELVSVARLTMSENLLVQLVTVHICHTRLLAIFGSHCL